MDDMLGAEKAYREGTRRAPGCASCYGSLASTLKDRNDLAGAERELRRGIANFAKGGAFPDINVLCNDLLALLDDKGDMRGAEMVYREVIENFPKDGDLSDLGMLFDRLGNVLDDIGDAIGAEKVFREGTRRAPGYAPCYTSLAGSLFERNDLKGVERVLQKAIKLEGADGECYCSLGGLRERQGDLTAAEAARRKAPLSWSRKTTNFVSNSGSFSRTRATRAVLRRCIERHCRYFPILLQGTPCGTLRRTTTSLSMSSIRCGSSSPLFRLDRDFSCSFRLTFT